MIEIQSLEEFDEWIHKDYVVAYFYADWCGVCKSLSVVFDEIQNEIDFPIVKVNVDRFHLLSKKYKVLSLPSILIFFQGDVLKEKKGMMRKDELLEFIQSR